MTDMPINRIAALTVLTVLAWMTTAACSGPNTESAPHGGSARAASDAHQVTLSLGTDDGRGFPAAQAATGTRTRCASSTRRVA